MSSNNSGMDVVLTRRGKLLKVGESLRMTLIKGPTTKDQLDPVANKKAKYLPPLESFPQVLKFGESVFRPDFKTAEWKSARFYQQNVPKAQLDSSEDEAEQAAAVAKSKRRRRNDAPKRQWVLQEKEEYVNYMICKKRGKPWDANAGSSRYEGTAESNPSRYVVLKALSDTQVSVQTMPPNAVQSMSQPRKRQALSMTQAEQAIQDSRGKLTRFMMHRESNGKSSKSRLMDKLSSSNNDDDDDDVMGDVAFRHKRKANATARRELLSSLADDGGITMDEEGVLGGTNNAEFGGKRHFGNFKSEQQDAKPKAEPDKKSSMGNDGLAMADDFYQRDVQAEYEELDYDANELFDDDDVDLGEAEVVVDTGGFAEDNDDDDDGDEEDEEVGEISGAAGLATVAGFRAMLAKARGETPTSTTSDDEGAGKEDESGKDHPASPSSQSSNNGPAAAGAANSPVAATTTASADAQAPVDTLAKIEAAAAVAAKKAAEKKGAAPATALAAATAEETDENGQRIISLDAIRREIWLHHGSIPLKRLMKIFDTKRATPERRKKFLGLVKELCIMKKDAVEGSILVLKQHYANMG